VGPPPPTHREACRLRAGIVLPRFGVAERSPSRRYVLFAAMLIAAVVFAGTAPASAQQTNAAGEYAQPHVVTVGFPFMLSGKQLPAGRYTIEQPTSELLIFQEEKNGAPRIEAAVITRLAAPATPLTASKLIFDKVGNTYYLSEVWFRNRDGFLLYGSKEAHTHQGVTAETKKK
jgi:hypothetical protein